MAQNQAIQQRYEGEELDKDGKTTRYLDLKSFQTSVFELNSHLQEVAGKMDSLKRTDEAYGVARQAMARMLADMEQLRGAVDSVVGWLERPG